MVPIGAQEFLVLEPLNGSHTSGALDGSANDLEAGTGRLAGRESVRLADAALSWDVDDSRECYVEFWIRPYGWSGDAPAGTSVAEFQVGDDNWQLFKPEDESVLLLAKNDDPVQSFPIYNWREREWMTNNDDDSRWHYIRFALSDGAAALFVNGFKASPSKAVPAEGGLKRVILGGSLETLFSELHVVPGKLGQLEARARYRDLYRGLPSIDPNTVTAPWVTQAPNTDGRIDPEEYREMATLIGFLNNRGPGRGALEGSGISGYIGYDENNLYIALRTPYEGELDFIRHNRRNAALSREESYEIFICPPWTGTPDYIQMLGNPHGDQADLRGMDSTWQGDWQWEAEVVDGAWTGELRMPFAGVEFPHPGDEEVWTMNLFNTHARTAWNPSQRYHDTGAFGVLRFAKNAPVIRPQELQIDEERVVATMEILGRGHQREFTVGMNLYGADDMLPFSSRTIQTELGEGDAFHEQLELDLNGVEEGILVLFVREEGTTLFSQSVRFPRAEPVIRQAHLRDDERDDALLEEEVKEDRETTPEELAYARTWTAAELGEELMLMSDWWDNDLGRGPEVPGPWTPMKVEDDRAVVTFGQRYEYADTLFPSQVVSAGEPLFAEPPTVVITSNGQELVFREAEVFIEQINEGEVRVRTVAEEGPFRLTLDTLYEFDGMGKVEFRLEKLGEPAPIDHAVMRYVMLPERSGLYHYSAGWGGHPPGTNAGATPAEGIQLDQFREILWLGDHYRGFTWFADRIENWQLKNEDAIQVVHADDQGNQVMEIKLADKPFVVDGPWEFVFGIQATPTRTVIPNRRVLADRNKAMLWQWHWGDGNSYYPFFADPEPAREHVHRMREQGREIMPASSQRFYRQYRSFRNIYGEVEDPGLRHRELLLWEPLWLQTRREIPDLTPLPERHTASGRWYGDEGTEPRGLLSLCAASPFQDYFLWRLNQTIEDTDLGAIYLDQPLGQCANALHGCGYIDYKGEWRPSGLVFARREFQKRMYKMFYEKHGFTRIKWHSSNHIIIPAISFTDIFFDGENYGHSDLKVYEFYSDVLDQGRMQAQHTGLPFGFAPALLPTLEERYGPTVATVSDMMGYFMVHDSHVRPIRSQQNALGNLLNERWFEFPFDDSRQYYYWEHYEGLEFEPEELLHIVHTTDDDCMVILFNPENSPINAEMRVDAQALGMTTAVNNLRDVEHGTVFSADDTGMFHIPLSPRDTRMLRLESRD